MRDTNKIKEFFNRSRLIHSRDPERVKDVRRQLEEIKRQRDDIQRKYHVSQHKEKIKLRRELFEIERSYRSLHEHVNPHRNNRVEHDFQNYYRRIKYTRYWFLIVNIILWFLLFWLGGVWTGLKIVILVFTLLMTVGTVFQMLFLLSIEKRILKPVDNLRKGVNEIANGNYDVEVENDMHTEVAVLIDDFNKMAKKLRSDEKLKTEYEENRKLLIANISHDLKTPITSIQGYIEALLDNKSPEKAEKYLKIIYNNSEYMNKLIDDLFLFSKLDLKKLDFNFEIKAFRPYFDDLMQEFALELEEKGVRLTVDSSLSGDYSVRLDGRRFHEALRNIIDNAVKYGQEKGLEIKADLRQDGGALRINIVNNGPAIPEEKLGHIFDRFYRVDTERTKDLSGSGLGLAIARELIEAHDGTIAASSPPDGGVCFTISMPIYTGPQG